MILSEDVDRYLQDVEQEVDEEVSSSSLGATL